MASTPAPTGSFKALASGTYHACAIRDSGELACWGSNSGGQLNAPGGRFVRVTAGDKHSCAIRETGVRVCWGTI